MSILFQCLVFIFFMFIHKVKDIHFHGVEFAIFFFCDSCFWIPFHQLLLSALKTKAERSKVCTAHRGKGTKGPFHIGLGHKAQ